LKAKTISDFLFPKLKPVLESDLQKAQSHLDILTKPPGSLGKLEKLAHRYVAIRNGDSTLNKKSIFVFANDHGVTKEGVSAYPKEVTPQMVYNFLSDGAAINVLAKHV
jgi:nicotinate-nucleotide--dimethylbenzimidazole phosphoribosyltransferase